MPRPKKNIEDKITEAGLFMLASKKGSLSTEEIEKYANKFSRNGWQKVFMNQEINLEIAKKYKNKVNFKMIRANNRGHIPFIKNIEILDELKNELTWDYISNGLDIYGVDKFADYLDFSKIGLTNILVFNTEGNPRYLPNWFLKKHAYRMDKSFSFHISKDDFEEFENIIDFASIDLSQIEEEEFDKLLAKFPKISIQSYLSSRSSRQYKAAFLAGDFDEIFSKPLSDEFLLRNIQHYRSFNQFLSENVVWEMVKQFPNLELPQSMMTKRLKYSDELVETLIDSHPNNIIHLCRQNLISDNLFESYLLDEKSTKLSKFNQRAVINLITENLLQKIREEPHRTEEIVEKYSKYLDNTRHWDIIAVIGIFSEDFYFQHADKIKFIQIDGRLNEWSQYENMSDSLKLFLHALGHGDLIEKRKRWREYASKVTN
jgi:hypothetical protein